MAKPIHANEVCNSLIFNKIPNGQFQPITPLAFLGNFQMERTINSLCSLCYVLIFFELCRGDPCGRPWEFIIFKCRGGSLCPQVWMFAYVGADFISARNICGTIWNRPLRIAVHYLIGYNTNGCYNYVQYCISKFQYLPKHKQNCLFNR